MIKKITAIIIAKNEQDKIADCIDSVKWADEVLLIDTGSDDLTKDIARQMGARVISYINSGSYDAWRTYAIKKAKYEWLLYIDADERSSEGLKNEILTTINSKKAYEAYALPRKNYILGQVFNYSGQWPDYQKRLFKKSGIKKWRGKVHEEPVFAGKLGLLNNPLIHFKHKEIGAMIEKTNKWSEIEAKLMYDADHPPMNVRRFLTGMLREFWLRMIKQRAYKDGKLGMIYAMYQVFSKFTTYAKLWELQERKDTT